MHGIIPSNILERIAVHGTDEAAVIANRTLAMSTAIRGQRAISQHSLVPATASVTVFDAAENEVPWDDSAKRGEHDGPTGDRTVDLMWEYAKAARDFAAVMNRDSINNQGHPINCYVRYGNRLANAFWNGQSLLFGSGDGQYLVNFILPDVVAHELGHGIEQHTGNRKYWGQSGAINEHMSDVWGLMTDQWMQGHNVHAASWLMGQGIWGPGVVNGRALRDASNPGSAYGPDPVVGSDQQPAHMSGYYRGDADQAGVHINSGILNRAFVLTALELGGNSWERAGKIWVRAQVSGKTRPSNSFRDFACIVADATETDWERRAVSAAFVAVGILP